jgi:hypothetical protein
MAGTSPKVVYATKHLPLFDYPQRRSGHIRSGQARKTTASGDAYGAQRCLAYPVLAKCIICVQGRT